MPGQRAVAVRLCSDAAASLDLSRRPFHMYMYKFRPLLPACRNFLHPPTFRLPLPTPPPPSWPRCTRHGLSLSALLEDVSRYRVAVSQHALFH